MLLEVRSFLSPLFAVAALVGVSASSTGCLQNLNKMSPEEQGRYFTLRIAGTSSQVRLDGARLYGQGVEVQAMDDGAIRGSTNGSAVDLRKTDDGAKGVIGTQVTDVHVARSDDSVHVTGVFAGVASDITVDTSTVRGKFGACNLDLVASTSEPGWYVGHRSCDLSKYETAFALPNAFSSLPPGEQGVYLLIALARGPVVSRRVM